MQLPGVQTEGSDGEQGAIIPESNLTHLMLRDEVVQAVKDGRFHVYPVSTVDEGIELLTGIQAGEMDEKGRYSENTVNHAVQARLKKLAETVKSYSFSPDGGKGNGK